MGMSLMCDMTGEKRDRKNSQAADELADTPQGTTRS